MISSRKIIDLHPALIKRFFAFKDAATAANIDFLVTCTYRDAEAQDALYAKGRTAPGPIVTNAKAGESAHNFRLAFDLVPILHGKPMWEKDAPEWLKLGELGEAQGLEWAGRWTKFQEFPHFQYLGGLSFQDLRAGKRPV